MCNIINEKIRLRFFIYSSLVLLFTIYSQSDIYAQSSQRMHNTYVEVWGNTGLFSLNYDFTFGNRIVGFRIGAMGEPKLETESPLNTFGIVSTANLLLGPSIHKFELGTGGFLEVDQGSNSTDLFWTSTVGYRYQGKPGGWILRSGLTPSFDGNEFIWRFGISIGRVIN